jgi:hypothetical protein
MSIKIYHTYRKYLIIVINITRKIRAAIVLL